MHFIQRLIQQRNWPEAERELLKVLAQKPFDFGALFALSYAHSEMGRVDLALSSLKKCHSLKPDSLPVLNNLCRLYIKSDEGREAIRYAQMAVRLQPKNPENHLTLSHVWSACRNARYAIEAIDNAITLSPVPPVEYLKIRLDLLNLLHLTQEGIDQARELLKLPGEQGNSDALMHLDRNLSKLSEWGELREIYPRFMQSLARPNASINPSGVMMCSDDPELILRVGHNSTAHITPRPRPARRPNTGQITVGYLSADFRNHPVAHMLIEVLSRHDRSRFRVLLLGIGKVDHSPIAEHLVSLTDGFIDLTRYTDRSAAEAIRAANVDILIDLMGVTFSHRIGIPAYRPCATQVLWMGCAVTTGRRHYDGFLLDSTVLPEGSEQFITEPAVRLPSCYHPISKGIVNGTSTLERADLGFPEPPQLLVGLPQSIDRIRPEFIEALARTIAPFPGASLVLRGKEPARARMLRDLEEWGLPASRIHFLEHQTERHDYLKVISLLDIYIDSSPYGGHSTAGEAIALGVPVLTSGGRCVHTRVAMSMLHQVGLGDLAIESVTVQMARLRELLTHPEQLAEHKRRAMTVTQDVLDAANLRLTRALENALVELHQSAQEHPEHPESAPAV
jgi:predicted O-linked N-acetylglucosamine transferase (SPINDLY family)